MLWKIGWRPSCEIQYDKMVEAGIIEHEIKLPEEEYYCRNNLMTKMQNFDDFDEIKLRPEHGKLKATWFGHSSVLIQFSNGLNCLVDPVFSKRCSPVKLLGPSRNTKVPMDIELLKEKEIEIHLVLISHDHFDHLDKSTINQIRKHYPEAKFITPLNTSKHIKAPKEKVKELTWWETTNLPDFDAKITAVPAQHWTQRSAFDAHRALWAGYVIECEGVSCYFAGDTGYCQAFKDIGKRFPNLTLALIPIGAYLPRWFMGPQHINPEEAVQVFQDLGCKNALGIHWLTFDLADDSGTMPAKELEYFKLKVKEKQGDADRFIVTPIGVTKTYE